MPIPAQMQLKTLICPPDFNRGRTIAIGVPAYSRAMPRISSTKAFCLSTPTHPGTCPTPGATRTLGRGSESKSMTSP